MFIRAAHTFVHMTFTPIFRNNWKGKKSVKEKEEGNRAQALPIAWKWERRALSLTAGESRVKNLNHWVTTTISTMVTIDETVDSDLRIDHS